MTDLDIDQDFLDGIDLASLWLQVDAEACERSLIKYLESSWSSFDPSPFRINWHLEAICEHLEAVSAGQIRKLLINIPPRHTKTNSVAIAWPTWTWARRPMKDYPLIGPQVRFLCTSYGTEKAQEDGVTGRRLIGSSWYQERWGAKSMLQRVMIMDDRDNQERYDTTAGGSRVSTGLGGSILGRGGDIKIIDDPIKTDDANSEVARKNVIRAYDEMFSTRSTDPKITAEVIIMQRFTEDDLSGHVISKNLGFEHICLPCEYDPKRHWVTSIGWSDPRGCDRDGNPLPDDKRAKREGLPLWPGRFDAAELAAFKTQPYVWAGQFQQMPEPRGGGIIKPEWWQLWPPQGEEFDDLGRPVKRLDYPPMDFILASLDTALTEKKENDPSAMTVWGTWRSPWESKPIKTDFDGARADGEEQDFIAEDMPRIMLINAWDDHLAIHDLVTKTIKTCLDHKVDRLLIEATSAGFSVAQEIARLCRGYHFSVMLQRPKGDKNSRLHAVAHIFAAKLVYAPERKWAQKCIDQCSAGSHGAHDDLADSTSQAIQHLRKIGEAPTMREYDQDVRDGLSYRSEPAPYEDIV